MTKLQLPNIVGGFRYYFSNGEHVLVGDDGRDTFVSILDCRLENFGFVVMPFGELANTLDEAKRIAVEAYRETRKLRA